MPAQQKTEKELVYLRDTIFQEGSTVTIVEHDTVKGKPRTITTTNTKIKLIRAAGQQKIVRDTVFLPAKLIKAQMAAIAKAKKNKGSERKFPYKIAIPILILLIFITILIFAYDKQYFSVHNVFNRIKSFID